MAKETNWVQGLTLALVLVFGIFALAGIGQKAPVNEVVDTSALIAAVNAATSVQNEQVNEQSNRIDTIYLQVTKEDTFKQTAVDLATAEWSEKDYKAIYNVLRNIDEKEDIDRIVVKDFKVTNIDVDNGDAEVTQELKVYYEDESGDDIKAYVFVTTLIEDGEVEEQDIELD